MTVATFKSLELFGLEEGPGATLLLLETLSDFDNSDNDAENDADAT
jgi:hypothetical protein